MPEIKKTASLHMLLTNRSAQALELMSSSIVGNSNIKKLPVYKQISSGATTGGYVPGSDSPYTAEWSYSPDGGKTLLSFRCELSGPRGITIIPSKSGPGAGNWALSEEPKWSEGEWYIRFFYKG